MCSISNAPFKDRGNGNNKKLLDLIKVSQSKPCILSLNI
jgi:hypothetical protein